MRGGGVFVRREHPVLVGIKVRKVLPRGPGRHLGLRQPMVIVRVARRHQRIPCGHAAHAGPGGPTRHEQHARPRHGRAHHLVGQPVDMPCGRAVANRVGVQAQRPRHHHPRRVAHRPWKRRGKPSPRMRTPCPPAFLPVVEPDRQQVRPRVLVLVQQHKVARDHRRRARPMLRHRHRQRMPPQLHALPVMAHETKRPKTRDHPAPVRSARRRGRVPQPRPALHLPRGERPPP